MALPFEILLGIYLGIITGIIPAVIAGVLGFVFKYFTGVTIPGLGVVVLALAIAGINGGLMALNDPTIRSSENATAIVTAILVVLMLALYAHAQGDKLGASVPRRVSFRKLRDRTLNTDVIELVGGRNEVKITVIGEIGDLEGYPPLSAADRAAIRDGEWRFPADLPVEELETRFADRLRSKLDLAAVSVELNANAEAVVSAAPPTGTISKRVPAGKRAVSVSALVPTGLARGEQVRIVAEDVTVEGVLIAAKTGAKSKEDQPTSDPKPVVTDGGSEEVQAAPAAAVTTGGEGRVTVAVTPKEAKRLLGVDHGKVVVLSRGTHHEIELTTLLKRAGVRFKRVTVDAVGPLAGHTIGAVDVREVYDVAILAVKHKRWEVAPQGSQLLSAGDELYVIGAPDAIKTFTEAAA